MLAEPASEGPVEEEIIRDPKAETRGTLGPEAPLERAASVVVLAVEQLEPLELLGAAEAQVGARQDARVVFGVPALNGDPLGAFLEALERVLADGLQHAEARLAVGTVLPAQQALVQQRSEVVERGATDRLGGRGGAAADEDAQLGEEALLARLEQLVAPVNGRPQGLLPRRQVARAAR